MTLRPHTLLCALALAAVASAQEAIPADPGGERPRAAQRIVEFFDFEEQLTNPLDLPEGWVRAQHDPLVPRVRPGFPIWNRAALDYKSPAHTGTGSVRAGIEGGSASLRLKPGVTPIFPFGQYLVRVAYRCEGLVNARPRLAVRALNGEGQPIPESERSVIAQDLDDEWQILAVELPGKFPDAAYLQIDLEVIQPRVYLPEHLPGHQIWDEDYEGAVWFDDVVVAQMPQLSLEAAAPLGIFTRPEAPTLRASLRDMAAQDMTATIRVYDSARRVVDSMSQPITTGRVTWDWSPDLPGLGWYRAVVEIAAWESLIASETQDFVFLAEPSQARRVYGSGPSFEGADTLPVAPTWRPVGIELTALPPGTPEELGAALGALGARSGTIPAWSRGLTAGGVPDHVERLRATIAAMRQAWVNPRLSLPVLPDEIAFPMHLYSGDVFDVLTAGQETWGPYLYEILDRLGATTARWQFGATGDDRNFARADTRADLDAVRDTFGKLVPGAELALAWRLDLDPARARGAGADLVRVGLPAWTSSTPVGPMIEPWLTGEGPVPEFVLEPASDRNHTEREIAADLARRTTELWAFAADKMPGRFCAGIADPWRIEPGEEPKAHPTVAAAAWRALADRLDGRVLAADWPITPGVRCLVFTAPADDPERGGLIAAWCVDAPEDSAFLHATLGPQTLTVYDIFGNARDAEPERIGEAERLEQRIALTSEPIFIENVNTDLAVFLASVAIDPALVESTTGEHEHAVTLHNPWPVPALGRIVVASPGGYDTDTQARDRTWEITPRTIPFELAPDESVRLPLVVAFSRAVEAGVQPFVLDIELTADTDYGWLRARAQTEIGWEAVHVDLTYRLPPRGSDGTVTVEATVTNTGDIPRALEATAFAPGQPRVRSSIGTLEPGQSIVRRFPFADAASALAGKRVMVSVSEADGPGRLTRGVDLPGR